MFAVSILSKLLRLSHISYYTTHHKIATQLEAQPHLNQFAAMSFKRGLLSLALLITTTVAAPHDVAQSATTTITLTSTSIVMQSAFTWPSKPAGSNGHYIPTTFCTATPPIPIDTSRGTQTFSFKGPELSISSPSQPTDTSRGQTTLIPSGACKATSTVTVTLGQPIDTSRGGATNVSIPKMKDSSKLIASSLSSVVLPQPSDTSLGQPPSSEGKPDLKDSPDLDDAYKSNKIDDSSNHSVYDPVAWADTNGKRSKRDSTSNTSRRSYWNYLFTHALPQVPMPPNAPPQIVRDEDEDVILQGKVDERKCVQCGKDDGDIICIGKTHYGYCDEGCAEPRRLYKGLKCVKGRVFADRS